MELIWVLEVHGWVDPVANLELSEGRIHGEKMCVKIYKAHPLFVLNKLQLSSCCTCTLRLGSSSAQVMLDLDYRSIDTLYYLSAYRQDKSAIVGRVLNRYYLCCNMPVTWGEAKYIAANSEHMIVASYWPQAVTLNFYAQVDLPVAYIIIPVADNNNTYWF